MGTGLKQENVVDDNKAEAQECSGAKEESQVQDQAEKRRLAEARDKEVFASWRAAIKYDNPSMHWCFVHPKNYPWVRERYLKELDNVKKDYQKKLTDILKDKTHIIVARDDIDAPRQKLRDLLVEMNCMKSLESIDHLEDASSFTDFPPWPLESQDLLRREVFDFRVT